MAEHHEIVPDRPENWKMDYSQLDNVTDYTGKLLTETKLEKDLRNYKKAWDGFREQFRSQPERPLGGGNRFNPPLDRIEFETQNPE